MTCITCVTSGLLFALGPSEDKEGSDGCGRWLGLTRRCPTAVMCWSERSRSVARDAGLGKSGTGWCGERRQGPPLAWWTEGAKECAVYAVSGGCRNVPSGGTCVRITSRMPGFRRELGRRMGSAPGAAVRGLQGGSRRLVRAPVRGERDCAYQGFRGLTTAHTRAVVPLPLPHGAHSVSGAVRARALTGVETK